MRHLIDPLDFSQQEITSLLDLADRICADPAAYQDVAAHLKSGRISGISAPADARNVVRFSIRPVDSDQKFRIFITGRDLGASF